MGYFLPMCKKKLDECINILCILFKKKQLNLISFSFFFFLFFFFLVMYWGCCGCKSFKWSSQMIDKGRREKGKRNSHKKNPPSLSSLSLTKPQISHILPQIFLPILLPPQINQYISPRQSPHLSPPSSPSLPFFFFVKICLSRPFSPCFQKSSIIFSVCLFSLPSSLPFVNWRVHLNNRKNLFSSPLPFPSSSFKNLVNSHHKSLPSSPSSPFKKLVNFSNC